MYDRHLLIAFGGLAGLEGSVEEYTNLKVSTICLEKIIGIIFHYFHEGMLGHNLLQSLE